MLSRIIADVEERLPGLRERAATIQKAAAQQKPARDFEAALRAPGLSVIAEIKRASPSRGVIDSVLDPAAKAVEYVQGGAAAISVLTEARHFHGSLEDLRLVRQSVDVPVLRKDFILEPVQIWESRAAGADSVLLIVAALDDEPLADLIAEVQAWGMTALVEVHDSNDVGRARAAGARVVGVNNRNLVSFEVDLATAESLSPLLDNAHPAVAESGIGNSGDAGRMKAAGYEAILVGESLVRAPDPGALLMELREGA